MPYDVRITTFHAFADSLIRTYPDAYPKIIGGRLASEIERIQLIEAILLTHLLRLCVRTVILLTM